MGMFDSFFIEYKGSELQVQTKRFGCTLDQWRIGDVVEGAPVGIHTYYETVWADVDGNIKYTQDITSIEIYITLSSFVFVNAFVLVKDHASPKPEVLRIIRNLNKDWADTNKFVNFAVQQLYNKQQKLQKLNSIIDSTLGDIKYWTEDRNKSIHTKALKSLYELHHKDFIELTTDKEFINTLLNKIERDRKAPNHSEKLESESELEQYKL
jgi:hypothetical protein